ncbi:MULTISPECIES: Pycsar system effector family protein [unclassified Streptomyces]|uniref:Pycsar system effector family protein n=1 Tax=unclassified Streptomyces TaxID=2593676 RepID=UPI003648D43E
MPSTAAAPDSDPVPYMLGALQTTHQHADTKAGILAAAQAALVGTAASWSRPALHTVERGGAGGVVAAVLLALFVGGLFGGAAFLAAALRPRVLRPEGVNRYSFTHLATGPDILPPQGLTGQEERLREELSQTVRFLARVAVRKYRCLTGAVCCTAVMGVSAGLLVVLRPWLA